MRLWRYGVSQDSLWYEQKERGVYVMGLCPGLTETEFSKRAGAKFGRVDMLIQQPEQVVDVALQALHKRQSPTVICGAANRFGAGLTRLAPRKWVVSMMGRQAQT